MNTTAKAKIQILILLMTMFSGCFLQPVERVVEKWNFIDWDHPELILAEPVKNVELLIRKNGKLVPVGKGDLPAGVRIRGGNPKKNNFEGH